MPTTSFSKVEIDHGFGFYEEEALLDLIYEASLVGFVRTVTLFIGNMHRDKPQIVTGTHTSGTSTTTLTDSAADFLEAGVQPGDVVTNTTDDNAIWEVVTVDSATACTVQLVTSGGTDDDFDSADVYNIKRRNQEDIYIPYDTEVKVTGRDLNKVFFRGVVQEIIPTDGQGRRLKIICISHEADVRDGVPQTTIADDTRSAVIQDALNQTENGQFIFPFVSNFEGTPGLEHSPNGQTVSPDFENSARSGLASFLDFGKSDYWCPITIQEPSNPVVTFSTEDEVQELVYPAAQGNLAQSFQVTGSNKTTLVSHIELYLGTVGGTVPTGNVYVRIEANNEDGDSAGNDIPSGELVTEWAESELLNITNISAGGAFKEFNFSRSVPLRDNTVYWLVLSYQEDAITDYISTSQYVSWHDDSAAGYANGTMATYSSNVWTASTGKDFAFQIYEYTDAIYTYDFSTTTWADYTTEAISDDASRFRFMGVAAGVGSSDVEDRMYIRTAGPIKGLKFDLDSTLASAEYGTITVKYYGDDGAKVIGDHTGADNNATILTDSDKEFRLSGVAIGDILHNKADDSYGVITAIGSTTLTVADLLDGGGDEWDKGDSYAVLNLEQLLTGTHDAASDGSILTDSTANFARDGVRVGDLVVNTTDNTVGVISAYSATTVTVAHASMSWDSGDAYKILSRWRTLTLLDTDITFTQTNEVKLEWVIPSDWVTTHFIAGRPETVDPSVTITPGDVRGYWLSIQTSVAPGTEADVDVVTPLPGSGFVFCVLDSTHEDVILAAGGVHDGSGGAANLQDSSEDFITTHGILIGDIVENVIDGSRGTVTGITSSASAIYDTLQMTLAGGGSNDWQVGEQYRILRERYRTCYYRVGSRPLGGPQTYGLTFRHKSPYSEQVWPLYSYQLSRSTRSTVNRVRVVGRTSGGVVVDEIVNNVAAQRRAKRIVMKTIVDYSIRSVAEAQDRGNTELARLDSQSRRGMIQTYGLPYTVKTIERQNWFVAGVNLLHKLDGNGSDVTVYEHETGASAAALQDNSQNFNKWRVEAGDLVQNITDGSEVTITSISTTTNENDTVNGTLAGGTDNDWDVSDEYRIKRRNYVRVGDLVRIKIDDPDYTDADFIVVGLRYQELTDICELRVARSLTAPAIGDAMTEGEIIQSIQDTAARSSQRGSY